MLFDFIYSKIKSLYLTKNHCQEDIFKLELQLHAFLTPALDEGEWSASHPGHFTPPGKSPQYQFDKMLGGTQSWSGLFTQSIHIKLNQKLQNQIYCNIFIGACHLFSSK
jgi:hypothetical protein